MALGRKRDRVDARSRASVDAAFRRSLRAAVAQDWRAAETWLERIVESDSTDLDAYLALARLYREQGEVGRAIRMHQNLLLRPGLDRALGREVRLELARDFDTGGFAERAAAGYEEVLDEEPRRAEALERRVLLSLELRDYARGLTLVKRWRRFDKDAAGRAEVELLLAQAQAQNDAGDADAARASLKKCLRRDKTCAEAWARLGELEAEKGRDGRAIDAWRKAIDADGRFASALLPRVEAGFAARKKPAEFEKYVRGLIETRPGDAAAHLALARTLKARGDVADGIEVLARAVEASPDAAELRVELGRQLLDAGLEREAQKAYVGLLDAIDRGALVTARPAPDDGGETKR